MPWENDYIQWTLKECGQSGHGLFRDTILSFTGEIEENHGKISVRIVNVPTKILTINLPNTNQKNHHLSQLAQWDKESDIMPILH